MKNFKIFGLFLLLALASVSCDKDLQDIVTADAREGGLLGIDNAIQNYVVGDNGSYAFNIRVYQSAEIKTKSINLYKSFVGTDGTSNEVLAATIDISNDDTHFVTSPAFNFTELVKDLTVGGNPLPSVESDLQLLDQFQFRFESVLDNGEKFFQSYIGKMTVSTRFAGTYLITAGSYFRIGVNNSPWGTGGTITVESVDAITYRWSEWGILSGWAGNELYFQVAEDGSISYPAEWEGVAQTLNGQPLTTCTANAADLANVGCATSNFVIKDDAAGKDQLKMVHGYFTGGSGPREFEVTMVKK